MNDYLNNISSIDPADLGTSIISTIVDNNSAIELPDHPPDITYSSTKDTDSPKIQEDAQYLSPQTIRVRKYTLKKG